MIRLASTFALLFSLFFLYFFTLVDCYNNNKVGESVCFPHPANALFTFDLDRIIAKDRTRHAANRTVGVAVR